MDEHDPHRPRAERYASAIAAAAAAQGRIAELTQQLEESEYHRSVAEQQLDMVKLDDQLGKVYTAAGEPPPSDVQGLLDLSDGHVYIRASYGAGTPREEWIRADKPQSGQMLREWPFEYGGPFIAFVEPSGFADVLRDARKRAEAEDAMHKALRERPGYRNDGDSAWFRPDLPDAVTRIVDTALAQVSKVNELVQKLEKELDELHAECDALRRTIKALPADPSLITVDL